MASSRLCSIEGCGKPYYGRGWCSAHYWRWKRHGDPLAGGTSPGTPAEYLKTVVLPYRGDDCLLWPFGSNSRGYGQIWTGVCGHLVHRIACEETNGPPPTPEHESAHSCGRGHQGCCAPRHLRWATSMENHADMILHGTSTRGSRSSNAKLTAAEVHEIRRFIGQMSQSAIADRFGVSPQTVCDIKHRRKWAWLP